MQTTFSVRPIPTKLGVIGGGPMNMHKVYNWMDDATKTGHCAGGDPIGGHGRVGRTAADN